MPFLEDLSSSAADSIVSAVSSNPVLAGTAVAGVAAVGTVLLVKTIYDNINVVSALDQTDLSRYTDLKNAWKINFPGLVLMGGFSPKSVGRSACVYSRNEREKCWSMLTLH